ncbi:hypothetical protein bcere0019_36680 [Bacillus cereus Rock3-28]|nr:hypothetical protein bcere0019_36680 [Bacillus cereus Rock3-28]
MIYINLIIMRYLVRRGIKEEMRVLSKQKSANKFANELANTYTE